MGKKAKNKDKDARVARKERAALKAEKKALKKGKKNARQGTEEDLDALLAAFEAEEAAKTAVTITEGTVAPTPRTNFSLTSVGAQECILFGGEYFDGVDTRCYNELYRMELQLDRGVAVDVRWTSISSPNTPTPRCSHQAVVYRDFVYFFGGEFTTTTQFHHYGDLWRLHLKTNAWERMPLLGSPPSPRSGHRMAVWRSQLVLFGGFYEATRGTRWFDDLYVMNLGDGAWTKIEHRPNVPQPTPRSGFGLAVHPPSDTLFIFGGYAKTKDAAKKETPVLHTDVWALRLRPLAAPQGVPTWERLARRGAAPSARSGASCSTHRNQAILFGGVMDEEGGRYSLVSTFYGDLHAYDLDRCRYYEFQLKTATQGGKKRRRKKAIATADVDASEGGPDGESEEGGNDAAENGAEQFGFWDDNGEMVYVDGADEEEAEIEEEGGASGPGSSSEGGDVDSAATGPNLAREEAEANADQGQAGAEKGGMVSNGEGHGKEQDGSDVEDENALTPAADFVAAEAQKVVNGEGEGKATEAEDEDADVPDESAVPRPCPRINAGMTVLGHKLVVYGGITEEGEREVTLDDLWVLDLGKREGWVRLLEGRFASQEWRGAGAANAAAEGSDDDVASDAFDSGSDDSDSASAPPSDDDEGGADVEVGSSQEADEEKKSVEAPADNTSVASVSDAPRKKKKKKKMERTQGLRARMQELHAQLGTDDGARTPSAGESCRDFFARTSEVWVRQLLEKRAGLADGQERFSEKELRREAFRLAQDRYATLEPLLQELDDLQLQQQEAERELAEASRKRRGKRG